MDTLKLLEQIANEVHYSNVVTDLVEEQAEDIKLAFLNNDADNLKKHFSNVNFYAHKSFVFNY